jgi:hypothetical protein
MSRLRNPLLHAGSAGLVLLSIFVLAAAGGGCAAMKVHPWDRDLLSEKKMQFNPSPMESAADDHIYFSKEGSTGGQGVGGGGCGCN